MTERQQGAIEGDRGDAKAEPSGPKGDDAGTGETKVTSGPAEQSEGQLNPSSPGDTGTTPGSVAKIG
jgi:hypothetical protein